MRKFQPKGKWVLVKPTENQKTYGKSFITADDMHGSPSVGKAIGVGNDVLDIKIDDDIMFQQNGNVPIKVEDDNLLLVHTQQILGTWTSIS
jgi:co-chaperonin GroES (HSP10)